MSCLSARGFRVLALDADPTALLGSYLGVSIRSTVGQVAERARKGVRSGVVSRPRDLVEAEIKRSLLHIGYGDLLTMGAPGGKGCYCAANSAVRATLEEMVRAGTAGASAGRYDVVLVDCEPGLEIFSRGTLDGVHELVVVAEPTAAGLLVAAQIWQSAEELGLPAARQPRETRPILRPARQPGYRQVLLNKVLSGSATLPTVSPGSLQPYLAVPADQFRVNGLVELLPLDNVGTMLALERSFSVGAEGGGNTIWLYEIQTQGATDVSGKFSLLNQVFTPVTKRLILNVETDLGIEPDNIEGMAFGPALPDGRLPLILMSDNNFAASQTTQFIVLAVELESTPTD
jgi:hypothetical protein